VAVEHRAAQDLAHHVALLDVARAHAVGDAEDGRAHVVGDAAHGDASGRAEGRGAADVGVDRVEQRAEERGVEVARQHRAALHRLDHAHETLEAGAGVDVAVRQRRQHAAVAALELREDEVPDLDEAATVGRGAARRRAPSSGWQSK
jgi:hypothetical protein